MSDHHGVGYGVKGLDSSAAYEEITKVVVFLDENNYIISGDDTGAELECSSPFATQEIAGDLLNRVAYFQYQPFKANGTFIDPSAEVGDSIDVGNVSSGIFNINYTFGTLLTADIEAPTTKEIDHEYPYKPKEDRQYERRMAEVGSRISQTASAIESEVEARTEADGEMSTLIQQTADRIELKFDNEFDDLHAYIRFVDGNIILGLENSPFQAILSNTKLSFLENGNEVAYAANNQFRMPYGVVDTTLDLGGYQLDATDGIKFKWKGREEDE